MADTSYIQTTLAQAIETLEKRRDEVTDQLRPLQDELREIDDALMRLTGGPTKARSRSGSTTPRGSNREKLLQTLRESGPMKAGEIGKATGISGFHAYLRQMKSSGEIKQDDDGRYRIVA